MDLRALITKMDQLSEAEDPAAVIAKYQEMGKKPTVDMPAFIDPKDGKVKYMDRGNMSMGQQPQVKVMPSDWIKRYAPDLAAALDAQGGNKSAYGTQDQNSFLGMKFNNGTKVNTAQAGADAFSAQFIKDMVSKITPLLDKVEKKAGVVNYGLGGTGAKLNANEGLKFTSGIAKVLAESLGYQLDEAEADPDMVELEKLFAQVVDIEDPAIKSLQDRYQKILKQKEEADKQKTDTSNAQADANASTAEGLKKKIARLKELLEKLKAKKSGSGSGQTATPAPGAKDPLAADPISQNAKPKTENMSEAEKYAAIRDRLAAIESRVDEGPFDLVKGAWNAGKGLYQAAKTGLSGAPVATGKLTKTGAAQMTGQGSQKFAKQLATMPKSQQVAYKAAQAVKNNPGKTALAATAAGVTTGYALSGDKNPGEAPTPAPSPTPGPGPKPTPGPSPTPTPGPSPTPAPSPQEPGEDPDMQEIGQLMSDIGQYTNPQDNPDASSVELATKALADAQAQLKTLGITK